MSSTRNWGTDFGGGPQQPESTRLFGTGVDLIIDTAHCYTGEAANTRLRSRRNWLGCLMPEGVDAWRKRHEASKDELRDERQFAITTGPIPRVAVAIEVGAARLKVVTASR
jgi:hypothetical protein